MFGDVDLTDEKCQGIVNDGSHHIYGPTKQVKKIYKLLDCDPAKLCEVNCTKIGTFPKLKITVVKTEFIIGPEDYIDKVSFSIPCFKLIYLLRFFIKNASTFLNSFSDIH